MIRIVKRGGAYNTPIVDFIMDFSSEVSSLPTSAPQGSTAYSIEDQLTYMLNSEGDWVPQINTGKDLLLIAIAKQYTDDAIAGTEGPLHGLSAYEIAQAHEYEGTEIEWLRDLQGKSARINDTTKNWETYDPISGDYEDTGVLARGTNGTNGLSAYDLWLNEGYEGSLEDFFNFLRRSLEELGHELYPTPYDWEQQAETVNFDEDFEVSEEQYHEGYVLVGTDGEAILDGKTVTPLELGENYRFSIYVKLGDGQPPDAAINFTIAEEGSYSHSYVPVNKYGKSTLSEEWQEFHLDFKWNEESEQPLDIYFSINGLDETNIFYAARPSLRKISIKDDTNRE